MPGRTRPNKKAMAGQPKKIAIIALKVLSGIIVLAVLLPALLFIPFVQNCVKDVAIRNVAESTGWDITLDRILLRFPLNLSLTNFSAVENGDTLIAASRMDVSVMVAPLLNLKAVVAKADLEGAYYKMDTEDGSMQLIARVDACRVCGVVADLSNNEVTVPEALLDGGQISLAYDPDKATVAEADTAASAPWKITVEKLTLNRVNYQMQMLPLIDNLDTYIHSATLADADIDMESYNISARYLGVDSVDCAYFTPSLAYLAEHPVAEDTVAVEVEETEPWTITADSLRLTRSHAIYAVSGEEPVEGLDMNYLEVSDINIAIDNLYNRGTDITVPIKNISARERSGLQLAARGTVAMDSVAVRAESLEITTGSSRIAADAYVDNGLLTDSLTGSFSLNAEADISISEIASVYPDINTMLPDGISQRRLTAMLVADGSMQEMNISTVALTLTDLLSLSAQGTVTNPTDIDHFGCDITIDGGVGELNFLKSFAIEDTATRNMINLMPMAIDGRVVADNGQYSGDMAITMQSGEMVMDAFWDGNATDYDLSFSVTGLEVADLLPTLGIGNLTAHGSVTGHGIDVFDSTTVINAVVEIDSVVYMQNPLSNITLNAALAGKEFDVDFSSQNKLCGLTATASGKLETADHYTFNIAADVASLDLQGLAMTDVPCNGSLAFEAAGDVDLATADYDIRASVGKLGWTFDENYYYTDDITLTFDCDTVTLAAGLHNGDFKIDFRAECGLDSLISGFMRSSEIAMEQVEKIEINMDTIQGALPHFTCELELGQKNLPQQFLDYIDFKHEGLRCKIVKDSTLYMYGRMDGIQTGSVKLDTAYMLVTEYNKRIGYRAHIGNREGTMQGVAAIDLTGSILGHTVKALFSQTDFEGQNGFRLGVQASLTDTTVSVGLFPATPIIAYKQWTVNEDNEVSFNYLTKHFDANLTLAYDNSEVSLISEHTHGTSVSTDSIDGQDKRVNRAEHTKLFGQEDISLIIKNVQIADWLSLSPLAPPVSAVLGTNIKLKYDGDKIWGAGKIALDTVVYSKQRLGDFALKAFIDLNANGGTEARASLGVDGRDCIKLSGSLQDTTATEPFKLALTIDRFPLALANAFLPKDMAEIQGYLEGDMKVTGTMLEPMLDGYMACDSTTFSMPIFGSTIELPSDKIPVDSSVIKFNKYQIKGMNENPLTINGYVNTADLSNQYIDLTLVGNNVQFVSAKQTRKSQLFGRGYINLNTAVKGYLSDLDIKASLTLLAGSNITYVLQDDISTLAAEAEEGMVKFVQFNDTSYVLVDSLEAVQSASNINLNANINIQSGSTVTVYVSQNGSDRAEIKPSGELSFAYTRLGDMTLNGLFKIEGGYVRYSPPIISQVNFTFNSDSYIRWTGDIMNPTLNLSAYENHKTTVTSESSGSRAVEFIVSMYVTNTLSSMDVSFDLETNDDISIQNELSSMSASQRSDQAINLMLYNTYTGSDSQSSSNLATNSLYSFLTSRLNSWAASTMKGIDVSFGVDQYSQTEDGVSSTETTYSYQVSKSLFDDRFKIVVGGSYTPSSSSSDDVASDLFNDVSLEYMLNKSGSMYVRLFNKSGYFNLLEGKVTQTGVGFVYKRKLYRLKDVFRLSRRKSAKADTNDGTAPAETTSL